ncbi:TetR/AcrR family transcriptional regulator [Serinibacter salmoneus]|uniref:TetR family transcriptional regulator n=1 Tax=Serinibacter salmoneus TaxID=556530 RepID=A0A2A9D2W4_9MICO|nr:TetR/AcrR family transcriptional regulator [Serinibacter salmoneus]PFG20585.1 TetR family transcriptional regulator [Serinibacter salmoneus]
MRSTERTRLAPAERRGAIVAAALSVLDDGAGDEGAGPPVAAVARRAGISEALVYHYFPTKADLFAAAVATRLAERAERVAGAWAGINGAPAREYMRIAVEAHLDHVAAHPSAWSHTLGTLGSEAAPARAARQAARADYLEAVALHLQPDPRPQRAYALAGHVAVLDGVAHHWVERGLPAHERDPLPTLVIDALQGSLGDWGR